MEIIYLERKKDCLYSSAIGQKMTVILHSMLHLISYFILQVTTNLVEIWWGGEFQNSVKFLEGYNNPWKWNQIIIKHKTLFNTENIWKSVPN